MADDHVSQHERLVGLRLNSIHVAVGDRQEAEEKEQVTSGEGQNVVDAEGKNQNDSGIVPGQRAIKCATSHKRKKAVSKAPDPQVYGR